MTSPTLLDLLANGKAEVKRAKAAKEFRHKNAATPSIDINALARQIEAELLWRSVALVTVFNEQQCLACGHSNIALTAIMVEQVHIREAGARRMLRSVENHPELPRRREQWVEHTDFCNECYVEEIPIVSFAPLTLPERKDHDEVATARIDLTKPLVATLLETKQS
jgi:hypothetical protein